MVRYLRVGLIDLFIVGEFQSPAGGVQTDVHLKTRIPGALPAFWPATVAAVNFSNYSRVEHCAVWLSYPNTERKKRNVKIFFKILGCLPLVPWLPEDFSIYFIHAVSDVVTCGSVKSRRLAFLQSFVPNDQSLHKYINLQT